MNRTKELFSGASSFNQDLRNEHIRSNKYEEHI